MIVASVEFVTRLMTTLADVFLVGVMMIAANLFVEHPIVAHMANVCSPVCVSATRDGPDLPIAVSRIHLSPS
jgi:hypothetical protein